MAVEFQPLKETAAEWIDTVAGSTAFALPIPEANDDYAYQGMDLAHWWPERNSKGAALFPEDIPDHLLQEWVGRQVNVHHDKKQVVGNLRTVAKTSAGLQGVVEIDRDQIEAHGLEIEDFGPRGRIIGSSVEFTRDPHRSKYLFHDDQGNIKSEMSTLEAMNLGKRRTTRVDPYKENGLTVTERCVPVRFTGLGLTWRPADSKALIHHVTASDEEAATIVFSRFDADQSPVTAKAPDTKESSMTEDEIAALQARADAAEAEVIRLNTKETASADEFATVDAERKQLKGEIITRDAEALLAFQTPEERAKFKETASLACDDDGVIRHLIVERKSAALEGHLEAANAKIKLLEAAQSGTLRPGDANVELNDPAKGKVPNVASGQTAALEDASSKTLGKRDDADGEKIEAKPTINKDQSKSDEHPQGDSAKSAAELEAEGKTAEAEAKRLDAEKAAAKAKETASEPEFKAKPPTVSFGPIYHDRQVAGTMSRQDVLNLA